MQVIVEVDSDAQAEQVRKFSDSLKASEAAARFSPGRPVVNRLTVISGEAQAFGLSVGDVLTVSEVAQALKTAPQNVNASERYARLMGRDTFRSRGVVFKMLRNGGSHA